MKTDPKPYPYVGPPEIAATAAGSKPGFHPRDVAELGGWLARTFAREREIVTTFVVDKAGRLRLAPRRSEHVACAGGEAVLSAGELTFRIDGTSGPRVTEATNQSTGFCPDPSSFPALGAELDRLGLSHPGRFTAEFIFRRCPKCGMT